MTQTMTQTATKGLEEIPQVIENFGGASRDRTDGLVVANDALSQLSYSPTWRNV